MAQLTGEIEAAWDTTRAERVHRNPFAMHRSRIRQGEFHYQRVARVSRPLELLIVDANREAAEELSWLVSGWGYSPRVAYDVQTGLRSAALQHPDVAVLFLEMAPLNGQLLAKQLRRQAKGKEIFIIGITERAEDEHRREFGECDIDVTLTTPIDPYVLETLLMLEQVRANRSLDSEPVAADQTDAETKFANVRRRLKPVLERTAAVAAAN